MAKLVFDTKDNTRIRRESRWLKIYMTDRPYFRFRHRRYYLDECMRLSHSIFFEDETEKLAYISGYYCISNTLALHFYKEF